MTVSPPGHVIRFYSNTQYALESVGFREITFLHPDKLNDPFDPPFYLATEFNNDLQSLIKYVEQYHPEEIEQFKTLATKESWEKFLSLMENFLYECRNNFFIFSTCGISKEEHPKDSLYMWSHYGNGHRGVAIEFDTALLINSLSKIPENKNPILGPKNLGRYGDGTPYEIKYESKLPKMTCQSMYKVIVSQDVTEIFNIVNLTFWLKSVVWEKEKEWRFILGNEDTKLKVLKIGLEDDTITAIYLGCRIDDRVKDDLIFEAKNKFPNAKIYKGKIAQGNFALEFEPLF
jgi:hypothetical protein